MARKKQSIAQRAVGLAAPVMPGPVATVVKTRWGARLFILLLPFLFATGILTISWNNGIPTLNFDRARAWLVGQQVGQRVEQEAMEAAAQQGWGQAQPTSWQQPPASPQQPYQQQPYQQYAPQPYQPQQATQPWGPPAYR